MDWFSTVLDLSGLPQPQDRVIDGLSLKSVLGGGEAFDRLGGYYPACVGVRVDENSSETMF